MGQQHGLVYALDAVQMVWRDLQRKRQPRYVRAVPTLWSLCVQQGLIDQTCGFVFDHGPVYGCVKLVVTVVPPCCVLSSEP
jgi:hypothetical protein